MAQVIQNNFRNFITRLRMMRGAGSLATVGLAVLTLGIIAPFYVERVVVEATTGAATESSLTFTSINPTASVSLSVSDPSGTFASSTDAQKAKFSISTTNYTGYTVSLKSSSQNLTDGINSLSPIPSALSQEDFSLSTNTQYNNKWGININGASAFVPVTSNVTIDETSSANTTAKEYTIALGVRADYTYAKSTYYNTFVLEYVANPVTYAITYNTSTTDSVSSMPSPNPQTGSVSGTTTIVKLSSNKPTRTGFTFAGWCSVATGTNTSTNSSTCSGKTYAAGADYGIDQTADNTIVNLYAMWNANPVTCTKQYRLQNANGTWGSYQNDGTVSTYYGLSCSYSKSVTNYKNSASGTNNSQVSTSASNLTGDKTLQLSFYRNTFTLTVNRNTTYIASASATTSAVHGTNYYRWGQAVSITASASSGNEFTSWTQSGTAGTFANASSASTAFTMGKGNATVTAGGKTSKLYMQDVTASTCPTTKTTAYDKRDEASYSIMKISNYCWMVQNLHFDISTTAMDTTTSNMAYAKQTSATSWMNTYTEPKIYKRDTSTYGYYYNYCAATAGSVCTTSKVETSTTQNICPKNWHLPTSAERSNSGLYAYKEYFSVVGNYYSNGKVEDRGGGYWWLATPHTEYAIGQAALYYTGSSMNSSWFYKNDGLPIRCIRT